MEADLQMGEDEESLAAELGAVGPAGVAAAARRRVVAAHGGASHGPDGESSACRWRWRAGWRPIPTRRAGTRRTRVSWRRGKVAAVPLAAALNGAKGALAVLNRRRGYADDLEPALRYNRVDRRTLDAMNEAVVASLPASAGTCARRRALLGPRRRPALVRPVRARRRERRRWRGPHATELVGDGVRRLLAVARRPRRPCVLGAVGRRRDPRREARRRVLHVGRRRREPRAHELRREPRLGVDARARARPRVPQRPRSPIARRCSAPRRWRSPETASIFCETLLFETALRETDRHHGAPLVARHVAGRRDAGGRRHPQSRFLFERELCERRRRTALSVVGAERRRCSTRRRRRTATGSTASTATRTCGR